MNILNATYKGSFVDFEKLPQLTMPEIAFAGRSNVGKSSLINYLCSNKNLAHTSSQPGKTQTFNYYEIKTNTLPFHLVDLPGYGFAKVPITLRKEWIVRMMTYFANRDKLKVIAILIDARIPTQKIDMEFIESIIKINVPFIILFTKFDIKLKNKAMPNVTSTLEYLKTNFRVVPFYCLTSSENKVGKEELLDFLKMKMFS
jgi:GTP-binding protein